MAVVFQNTFVNSAQMGSFQAIDNIILHYYEDGEGRPVLLLPPAGLSLFTFRRNIPYLGQFCRTIALDLPGGYTRFPADADFSPQGMAALIARFLEALGLEKVVLCGAGEGGIYALETALRYPALVSALVLVSPGSVTRTYPLSMRYLDSPRVGEFFMNRFSAGILARFLSWCYFDETLVNGYMLRQCMLPYDIAQARQGLLLQLRGYQDGFVFDHLHRAQQPALLVWGDRDAAHPPAMAREFLNEMPDCRLLKLPRCGYLPHEEKSREFNHAVLEFLDSLPEAQAGRRRYRQIRINFET
ncbi:MAG: alpha/beta hydrolase [Eubacteriales bacterium]|nr:alpha/beta hydrolase [Eubacteriales bacterium]